jgi:PIN domain nuclease of toxin-antitoxin system
MTNYLLDTHTFLWFIDGDDSLSDRVIKQIKNVENQCYISIASIWEISIKMSLKKLEIAAGFNTISKFCDKNDIEVLPVTFEHILELNKLDLHHRDPFDRIIIAQGIAEELTVLSKDGNFKHYPVKVLW